MELGGEQNYETYYLREELAELKVYFMQLKDNYAELAAALGYTRVGFYGDVNVNHHDIVERAKEYRRKVVPK